MTKKNIMPVLVLTVICVTVAALLDAVNMLTEDKIKQNALLKEQQSLTEVLPSDDGFDEISTDGLPSTVKSAYKEKSGKGFVFIMTTSTSYSSGDMTISVGISNGAVVGVKLTSYQESKDFGKTTYPEKYVGATKQTYSSVEITSGVTYSSNAFKAAIGDALDAAEMLTVGGTAMLLSAVAVSGALPRDESEITAAMTETVKGAVGFEDVTPAERPETLKRLYKEKIGKGYVAYIVTAGEYVEVATEGVVWFGTDGRIKAVKLLTWTVGHGVDYGDFESRFTGKTKDNVTKTELVTSATYTSGDFRQAVSDAFAYIPKAFPTARVVGIALLSLAVAAFTAACIYKRVKFSRNAA